MRRATEANPVSIDELRELARARFGELVKAVVDLRRSTAFASDATRGAPCAASNVPVSGTPIGPDGM